MGGACLPAVAQVDTDTRTSGPCSMPAFEAVLQEPNIFSEQQEEWLGEILSSQIEVQFKIIPDPENDYLQKLAERLLAQLPQSKIHYRFTIIDLPENNAFGIPGGHIYVSRRIIALAQNEDELAGLIGHEIGHIITRQPAIDLTRAFATVIGVNQLGDRADVAQKWNRLMDMAATRTEKHSQKREEEEQLIADRIAMYAMTRAGYQPSHYVEFFDRLAQTRGNKGSFWTDLFGHTSSDARRLRDLLRNATPLAQGCRSSAPVDTADQFSRWQKSVVASNFAVAKEAIPGLLSRQTLNPPLRSDLRALRFSPDGKYLLAQDENSIFVLSSDPVTNVFRIDTPDTYAPQFTPDSRAIVFYDKELRVQKWDVEGKRVFVRALALPTHCLETALSHSGEVLACLDDHLEPQLIDVGSSSIIYKGRKLNPANDLQTVVVFLDFERGGFDRLPMRFSPDDHYFIAGHAGSAFAYDLKSKSEVSVGPSIKDLTSVAFTFVSNDEIAGYSVNLSKKGIVRARFPSGEIEDSIGWGITGNLRVPQKGDYLMVIREEEPAVRVFNWKTKKTLVIYKKPAFDLYGDIFAGESVGGQVGIYSVQGSKYRGGVDLPNGPLSTTTAAALSPNGKWLAISQQTRGAVWNLATGDRTFLTRGFQGAFFDEDQLFAEFPKQGKEAAGVFKLDPASGTIQNLYDLKSDGTPVGRPGSERGDYYWQQGDLLLRASHVNNKEKSDFLVEVLDVRTNRKLWELKPFKGLPYMRYSRAGKTITVLIGNYDDMKAEARGDTALNAKLDSLSDEKRRKASYIIEALEDSTGKALGKLVVDTGNLSFKLTSAFTVGDHVIISDSENRTLLYSLKTGEHKGTLFGYPLAISHDGERMLVENGSGKADVYDLSSLNALAHFEFPFAVVRAEFSPDASRMVVLTSDQTIYRLTMNAQEKSAAVQ